MDRQNKWTLPPHPNLILLESALIAAEKLAPSRAPRRPLDPDEALAARLIENIKHPQPVLFPAMRIESPMPLRREAILETAGSDV